MKTWLSFLIAIVIFACSPNNVTIDNSLKKYFDENKVDGTFALMNNGTGQFTIYNLARYRDSSFLPASTFKIVNSLIGLQTGVITSDSMVIKWDSVKRWNDAWNKDLSMYDAFRISAVNYYQEVARRIGKESMQKYLDTLAYGSKKITTAIDSFWLDGSLTITPDEQLGLMKRLYFNQLPFFPVYQDVVKNAMLFENDPNYRLGYKTGWGRDSVTNRNIGWVIGWVEENRHPYFFVLNLETHDPNLDMVKVRMKILKDILKQLGFFEGKM
jgi:beta-lactamase class D